MHLFKMRMLTLFRNKTIIFWSLIFPIVLCTFYSLAFSNISNNSFIDVINIAVVKNDELDENFLIFIQEAKLNEEDKMFKVFLKTEIEAKELLNTNEVVGIISSSDNKITLMVNNSGLNQTITKAVIDEYLQVSAAVFDLMVLAPGDPTEIINDLVNSKNYIITSSNTNANILLVMYFSVIGMALIYGGFWGTDNILNLQANMSAKGVRVAVSPVNRLKIIFIYTLCAFVIHMIIITILLLYLTFALGIDFGDKFIYTYLVCVLGSLVGISFGSFVSISLKKAGEGIKVMVTILVGVIGGFLSGMMVANMKYIVQTKAPFLSYINPVSVITDALHTLNYFGTTSRFYLNIAILGIMIVVFTFGTYLFYRRDNYESI